MYIISYVLYGIYQLAIGTPLEYDIIIRNTKYTYTCVPSSDQMHFLSDYVLSYKFVLFVRFNYSQ